MIIPYRELEPDTLVRLIEDFVTREGTDNGDETPLEQRVARVRHALERGEAVIVFNPLNEQCGLMQKSQVPRELLED